MTSMQNHTARWLLAACLVTCATGCPSREPSPSVSDLGMADMNLDASPDDMTRDSDLGPSDMTSEPDLVDMQADLAMTPDMQVTQDMQREVLPWQNLSERATRAIDVDALEITALPPKPAECANASPGSHTFLIAQRGYEARGSTIMTWGKDHYPHFLDFSDAETHDYAGSEITALPLYHLPNGDRGQIRMMSGDGFIHEPPANVPDARYIIGNERLREDFINTQVLTLDDNARAYVYDKLTLDLFACTIDPEPSCTPMGKLPEPLHSRLPLPTWLGDGFLWAGEENFWWTDGEDGTSRKLTRNALTGEAAPRALVASHTWLAWIDAEGTLLAAHTTNDEILILNHNIPDPALDQSPSDYFLDILTLDEQNLYWFDGEAIRGVDLDAQKRLNLADAGLRAIETPLWLLVDECGYHVHHGDAMIGSWRTDRIVRP